MWRLVSYFIRTLAFLGKLMYRKKLLLHRDKKWEGGVGFHKILSNAALSHMRNGILKIILTVVAKEREKEGEAK